MENNLVQSTNQWICVMDGYPDMGEWVLISCITSDGKYRFHPDVAIWKGVYWGTESGEDLEYRCGVLVTHWMSIPEVPELG